MLRRAWNDSVWSKVIAARITAGLAAIGAVVAKHLERVFEVGGAAAALLGRSITIPVWLVIGVLVVVVVLAALVLIFWQRKRPPPPGDEVQPNAVPIVLVSPRR